MEVVHEWWLFVSTCVGLNPGVWARGIVLVVGPVIHLPTVCFKPSLNAKVCTYKITLVVIPSPIDAFSCRFSIPRITATAGKETVNKILNYRGGNRWTQSPSFKSVQVLTAPLHPRTKFCHGITGGDHAQGVWQCTCRTRRSRPP